MKNIKFENLLEKVPDQWTGKTQILQGKCRELYGQKDCTEIIREIKIYNLKLYSMVFALLFCVILWGTASYLLGEDFIVSTAKQAKYIQRPGNKEMPIQVDAKVEASYNGVRSERDMRIIVNPQKLSKVEEEKILKKYSGQLESLILGENPSLRQVSKPLNLLEYEEDFGIALVWSSSQEDVVDTKGIVDLIKAENSSAKKSIEIKLDCQLALGDTMIEKSIPICVVQPKDKKQYEGSLENRLQALEGALSQNQELKKISLPKELGDGVVLQWNENKTMDIGGLLILCILLLVLLYKNRYRKIDKELLRVKESMIRDFPELINKMVLLLNAGLVVTSAISKIAGDYDRYRQEGGENLKGRRPLYEELCIIERRIKESNVPIGPELKSFARRSGLKEILRFSSILDENMNKGTVLAEKLQAEAQILWLSRKKRAEEKGRLAETKLTLPLMVLLLILIMVTVSPTFLEM